MGQFSLGDEVAWVHVTWTAGVPNKWWRTGFVEIVRKDTVVIRRRGCSWTSEVAKADLLLRNTVKPRRAGNSNWEKP